MVEELGVADLLGEALLERVTLWDVTPTTSLPGRNVAGLLPPPPTSTTLLRTVVAFGSEPGRLASCTGSDLAPLEIADEVRRAEEQEREDDREPTPRRGETWLCQGSLLDAREASGVLRLGVREDRPQHAPWCLPGALRHQVAELHRVAADQEHCEAGHDRGRAEDHVRGDPLHPA